MKRLLSIILFVFVPVSFMACGGEIVYSEPVWLKQGEHIEGVATGKIYFVRFEKDSVVLKRKKNGLSQRKRAR